MPCCSATAQASLSSIAVNKRKQAVSNTGALGSVACSPRRSRARTVSVPASSKSDLSLSTEASTLDRDT
jgi:hypothetical protein